MNQSWFDLAETAKKQPILLKQTSKVVDFFSSDLAGFYVRFEENGDLCREAWENKDYKYLFSDPIKKGSIFRALTKRNHEHTKKTCTRNKPLLRSNKTINLVSERFFQKQTVRFANFA